MFSVLVVFLTKLQRLFGRCVSRLEGAEALAHIGTCLVPVCTQFALVLVHIINFYAIHSFFLQSSHCSTIIRKGLGVYIGVGEEMWKVMNRAYLLAPATVCGVLCK
jgi:hypothetical protein